MSRAIIWSDMPEFRAAFDHEDQNIFNAFIASRLAEMGFTVKYVTRSQDFDSEVAEKWAKKMNNPYKAEWHKDMVEAFQSGDWARWEPYFFQICQTAHDLSWTPVARMMIPEPGMTTTERESLYGWLMENCRAGAVIHSEVCVLFENNDDAILCKLTWQSDGC